MFIKRKNILCLTTGVKKRDNFKPILGPVLFSVMSLKSPFNEGPTYKRVYDKNDVIIQAMLNAGLEELITNGFYMEEVRDGINKPKGEKITAKPNVIYKEIKGRPPVKKPAEIAPPVETRETSDETREFNKILAELYQMEEDLKIKTEST